MEFQNSLSNSSFPTEADIIKDLHSQLYVPRMMAIENYGNSSSYIVPEKVIELENKNFEKLVNTTAYSEYKNRSYSNQSVKAISDQWGYNKCRSYGRMIRYLYDIIVNLPEIKKVITASYIDDVDIEHTSKKIYDYLHNRYGMAMFQNKTFESADKMRLGLPVLEISTSIPQLKNAVNVKNKYIQLVQQEEKEETLVDMYDDSNLAIINKCDDEEFKDFEFSETDITQHILINKTFAFNNDVLQIKMNFSKNTKDYGFNLYANYDPIFYSDKMDDQMKSQMILNYLMGDFSKLFELSFLHNAFDLTEYNKIEGDGACFFRALYIAIEIKMLISRMLTKKIN